MSLFLGVYAGAGTLVRASADVAKIGSDTYSSLGNAVKAAKAGDTITLIADSSSADLPNISKNLTLDLNGFTYKNTSSQMYPFAITSNAVVTVKDSSSSASGKFVHSGQYGIYASAGKFVLESGSIETSAECAVSVNSGSIDIKGGTINAGNAKGYAVYAFNKNQPSINVSGGVINSQGYGVALADCSATFSMTAGTINSKLFALTTNGSSEKVGTMKILGGTLKSESIAVYLPSGVMTIGGGTITGATAVYMKSGNLKISGGTMEATGAKAAYKYYNNGAYSTGDALAVDNCGYPNGAPVIEVTGGTFKSANAEPIGTYAYGSGNNKIEKFVSGGTFSSAVSVKTLKEGYRSVKTDDGKMYTVSNLYTVSFDIPGVPEQKVVYGQTATKPADPIKAGFFFAGWYYGDVKFDFSIIVTQDMKLVAKWKEAPKTHKLSFADFVERLYNVALGRESEKEGKDFWVEKVTNGEFTGGYCALFFLTGPEFLQKNTTDDEFLTTLYKTFFDREPEKGGFDFWKDWLKNGHSRQEVIESFVDSAEWCNLCAKYGVNPGAPNAKATEPSESSVEFSTRLYTKCLGREPEQKGLRYWSLRLTNRDITGAELGKQFFESEEYMNKKSSNADYVTALYRTFLDREPETDGFNYWTTRLKDGASRRELLRGFVSSQEYTNLCKSYGFERGDI